MTSDLKQSFLSFTKEKKLFDEDDEVLLACSGGIDSMVLFHLLLACDINFHVAHVNYGLRDRASNEDERFVQSTCQNYFIPCHIEKITTEPKGNTQNWARQIRYNYFEKVVKENNLACIVTAHHFDDQIETFILNFTRGSGLSGLTGMSESRDYLRRPLLFARKSQIEQYASENHVAWREDHTNDEDYYLRNKVRHHITPVLNKLRNHDIGMRHSLSHLKELDRWLRHYFQSRLDSYKKENTEWQFILRDFEDASSSFELFQMLRILDFTADQVNKMIDSNRTGSRFENDSHLAIIDRGILRIRERIDHVFHEKIIEDFDQNFRLALGTIELSFKKVEGNFVEKSHTRSYFDLDKLIWPLKIRKWRHADRFQPYGMYGKTKKVSDLLVQLRLSHFEKEETLLLLDGRDTILWVIGHRRSMDCPVHEHTKKCLRISVVSD